MKEVKAFIHNNRIAAVIRALNDSGYLDSTNPKRVRNVNVGTTQSLLGALGAHEQHYSVDLGQLVIKEAKLELLCEDAQADEIAKVIANAARTGQDEAGWVCVNDVKTVLKVSGNSPSASPPRP